MSNEVAISIVSIPDIAALRAIHRLDGLSDESVLSAVLHLHNQRTGSRTLPLYQQQIVSLVVIKRSEANEISITCLGNAKSAEVDTKQTEVNTKRVEVSGEQGEASLLKKFDDLVGDDSTLIAWDANAHDLPLINYRLLQHSLVSENISNAATVDLKAILSNGHSSASADLAGLSSSLGLAELSEMDQQETTRYFLDNQLQKTHRANQVRALNSYQIYLRYQLIRAKLSATEYQSICESLREAHIL